MSFGERLQSIREQLGLSRSELAGMLGVSSSYVGNIETGIRSPSELLVKALARTLGLSEEWLQTGEGPQRPSVSQVIMESTRFYPRHERRDGLIKMLEAELANNIDPRLHEMIAQLHLAKLADLINWIVEAWNSGDEDFHGWLYTQFKMCFPQFEQYLQKKHGCPEGHSEAAALDTA